MYVEIEKHEILTSGKFYAQNRAADIPVKYSIGYSYNTSLAGVSLRLTDLEYKHMEFRLTPEQAERMAAELTEWAAKTRVYQNQAEQP